MKFSDWVEKQRVGISRTKFLRNLSKQSGVSLQTLQFVAKGGRLSLYAKAQAVAGVTGGEVSVTELCE